MGGRFWNCLQGSVVFPRSQVGCPLTLHYTTLPHLLPWAPDMDPSNSAQVGESSLGHLSGARTLTHRSKEGLGGVTETAPQCWETPISHR